MQSEVMNSNIVRLAKAAWEARERAHIIGKTKVGCALLTRNGHVFAACNVEHKFRSHDIHAEVNAIGSMVAGGGDQIVVLVVVAERDRFTPCGACMDWIMQFGGKDCVIAFQGSMDGKMERYTAHELMPFYPT